MCTAVSLLHLPNVALEKIFSYMSYDEMAKNRLVCRKFNVLCSQLLTRGFHQTERRHNAIYKKMKSMLPRRESERRNHPLARHCDILSAVETRISMLNMTFMKYIENNICCFIPGKVIDEIDRILTLVEKTGTAPRTHELLQELRDISSMAMEHFDEQILPTLKNQLESPQVDFDLPLPVLPLGESSSSRPPLVIVHKSVSEELRKIRRQNKSNKQQMAMMQQQVLKLWKKIKAQNGRIKAQTVKIREQEKKLQDQVAKIQDSETVINDMKKHIEEWDQKFSDLTAELIRAREDLTMKSRLSPAPQPPISPPKIARPNFRPRIGHILPRNSIPRSNYLFHSELERKRKSEIGAEIPCKLSKGLGPSSKISEDISNKINENITNNISKNITDNMMASSQGEKLKEPIVSGKKEGLSFLTSSLETFLKKPLTSIKSRKRKMTEDIDLK